MKANMLLMLKTTFNDRFVQLILILMSLVILSSVVKAQPFTQRQTWDGPYDIKMIAAPNLEAVYIDPNRAANSILDADSIIRPATMQMTGDLFEINNRYKGGSPFVNFNIPVTALICKDPNAPCLDGLTLASPNSSCPTRYNAPATVNRHVSMNYADYDTDNTTYASSMAKLEISECTEIQAAYLYWAGNFRGSNPAITLHTPTTTVGSYTGTGNVFNVTTTSGYDQVRFKRPGGAYQNVTAVTRYSTASTYVCVANVTAQLQGTGGGEFWVGNIQSYPNEGDGGSTSGWTLVVVFRSPLSPPRLISLWDGFKNIPANSSEAFLLTGLQAPATANFQSYVGFAALDGENLATQLDANDPREGLGFQTNAGGASFSINPFATDQPKYRLWNKKGYPATISEGDNIDGCRTPLFDNNWALVNDGVSSSHISSYSEVNNLNGNEIVRLPSMINTLGFDAHHMKLPDGAVAANATQATLRVNAGPQGSTMPYMAYIAIERLQPKLEMTKSSDVNTTSTNTEITYTLKIKNNGNAISLGGDIIRDTLDLATTYVAGSLVTIPASSASITSSNTIADGRQSLEMNVSRTIPPKDSITITFKVQVKDYASNISLWDVQCKRSILNTAWIEYNTLSSGILKAISNGSDCGIGSETRVLIMDPLFAGSSNTIKIGPFNACPYITESVYEHIISELRTAGVSAADIDSYDIRDEAYVRVRPEDVFLAAPTSVYYAIRDYNTAGTCQQIYEITFTSCTLPLGFLSFTVQPSAQGALLQWSTVSKNSKYHYIVEKSINGHTFYPIAKIQGHTHHNYDFIDAESTQGIAYYRIVQYDHEGGKKYSHIVSLIDESDLALSLYPNPFTNTVNLRVKSQSESKYTIRISDLTGKLVYSSEDHTANEIITLGNDLGAGVYLVEVVFDEFRIAERLVKLY